jgi:hypothetical protein
MESGRGVGKAFGRLGMTTQTERIERLVFALLAIAFCLLFAFRPIPSEVAENDTGRYVAFFQQYCKGLFATEEYNKEISFEVFNLASLPGCFPASDGFFLFQAAFYLPLALLVFVTWRTGAFSWATGLLASFYGIELMANALRQGLATMMFFGALAMVRKHSLMALVLGGLAAVTHAAAIAFYPFLVWLCLAEMTRKDKLWSGLILALTVVGFVLAYRTTVLEFFVNLDEMFALYREFYVEEINPLFLAYVCVPLYFIDGLRRIYEAEFMSSAERQGVAYSTAAILICLVFFPFITFRIVLFAVPMQIFLVVTSERHSVSIGGIALTGLVAHLAYFFLTSSYYDVFFTG